MEKEKEEHFIYDFGGNEHIDVIKSKRGYYCYGFVAGTTINTNGKDMGEIEININKTLLNAKEDYLNKASRVEVIALSIKNSGLEKTAKDYENPIKMNKQGDKK